jgi:voltage-gated potassium channel
MESDPQPPTLPARSLRERVWDLVEAGGGSSRGGGNNPKLWSGRARHDWFDWTIALLIVLNVVALMLESDKGIDAAYHPWFVAFEAASLLAFGVEYALRLWACTADPRYARPVVGRLRFALRPLQLIDLLALLPAVLFFLPGVPDLRFVRAVRLLRILRVLKLGRYSDAVALLGRVLSQRRAELAVTGLVLVVLLVVAASALHFAEADAQPEKFGSIPDSLWWAVITLTTIGYGDVYPVTPLGKVFGGLIAWPDRHRGPADRDHRVGVLEELRKGVRGRDRDDRAANAYPIRQRHAMVPLHAGGRAPRVPPLRQAGRSARRVRHRVTATGRLLPKRFVYLPDLGHDDPLQLRPPARSGVAVGVEGRFPLRPGGPVDPHDVVVAGRGHRPLALRLPPQHEPQHEPDQHEQPGQHQGGDHPAADGDELEGGRGQASDPT